jgi:C4-dicarboxylate transporter, DctM subunit
MNLFAVACLGILLLLVLMAFKVHIGISLAVVGVLGFAYINGFQSALGILAAVPFRTVASYTFSIVPLFLLMGYFSFQAGISQDVFTSAHKWLARMPGGLAMATIAGCTGFAAACGSSVATAATMCTVALPEMRRYKYKDTLATGCIAAGGTIGIIIPPSINFVVYGAVTETSIGKLFASGILSGILVAVLYILAIYIVCKRDPAMGPLGPSSTMREKLISLKGVWAILGLFLLVMGGIYFGVFTPSEAGAVGAFGAFIIALAKRKLTWNGLSKSLLDTGKTTSMIMVIVIGTMIFGYFLTITKMPLTIAETITAMALNKYLVITTVLLLFFILGCIMDTLAIIMLVVPIVYPVITALGFDPIWFGTMCVLLSCIGLITPPLGLNVYVVKGMTKDMELFTVFKGIVPFLVADIVAVILLVFFPDIALYLPRTMLG